MEPTRLLPLSGLGFVGLVAASVALALGTGAPDGTATPAEIAAYYDRHWVLQFAVSFLLAASVPFLVLFAAGIAAARPPGDARRLVWERVLVGGSVLMGAVILVIALANLALVDGSRNDASGAALETLNMLVGSVWIAQGAALGVLMLGAAGMFLSAPRSGALGWPALLLGIGLFIPVVDFFALLLTGIWIVVAAVACARPPGARYGVAHEPA
jgi:hypothetical protein